MNKSSGSNELHYVANDGAIRVVSVEADPTLRVGRPSKLCELSEQLTLGTGPRTYDVAAGGRFLGRSVAEDAAQQVELTVILHWFEELREQAPIPD